MSFLVFGERRRTRVEDGDGAKSMSSNAPNLLLSATGSFALFGTRSLVSFWFPFLGDRAFLSTRDIFSGSCCVSGSCGVLGSYAWRTCRSRFRKCAAIVNTRTRIGWFVHRDRWEYLTLVGLCRGIFLVNFQSWSIRLHIWFLYMKDADDSFYFWVINFSFGFNFKKLFFLFL